MFKAAYFRDLVSGRQRGPAASLLRGAMRFAEYPYTWAIERRNRAFDIGRFPIQRVGVPVISVGNLTMGGTGKTPMVEWVARQCLNFGLRVALVSRGYKSRPGALNDEGEELKQKLPSVPHLQNPDRVAAAREAVQRFDSQIIILDDGFQHRRIHRDLDIVLIDALEPFGFGHVFPRGMLREPLTGFTRANLTVLTRADMVDETERARIRAVVKQYAPSIGWAECRHAPCGLLAADGHQESLGTLRGKPVVAFCGLGNPVGFRHTLEECGYEVVAWREFPDHFIYNQNTLDELSRWVDSHDAKAVVCTHKDLVKLAIKELADRPLWALLVGLEFMAGQAELELRLEKMLAQNTAAG